MNDIPDEITYHLDLLRRELESRAPVDMRGIPHPVIGYSGAIAEWFDFELLELVAESFAECSIVLVGPVFAKQVVAMQDVIAKHNNVYHLGPKQHDQLPYYILAFDVCIIPLKMNELMRSSDPNKIYEYAACGKPIVTVEYSSDIAQLNGLVHVAKTHAEFIECIRLALKPPSIYVLTGGSE